MTKRLAGVEYVKIPYSSGEISKDYMGDLSTINLSSSCYRNVNSYSTLAENFIKRSGTRTLRISKKEMITIQPNEFETIVIEDNDGSSSNFALYRNRSGEAITGDTLVNININELKLYNVLSYSTPESENQTLNKFLIAFQSGIYEISLDDTGVLKVESRVDNQSGGGSSVIKTVKDTYTKTTPFERDDSKGIFNIFGLKEVFKGMIDEIEKRKSQAVAGKVEVVLSDLGQRFYDLYQKITTPPLIYDIYTDKSIYNYMMNEGLDYPFFSQVPFTYTYATVYNVETKPSLLYDINDFSKSVLWDFRLFIFSRDTIYYSSMWNLFEFNPSAVPPVQYAIDPNKNYISKAGAIKFGEYFGSNFNIQSVLNVHDGVVITTDSSTYYMVVDETNPTGFKIKLLSTKGSVESGLVFLDNAVYKLHTKSLRRIENFDTFTANKELDFAIYQKHIFDLNHRQISFRQDNSTSSLFTLREDGIVFRFDLIENRTDTNTYYTSNLSRYRYADGIVVWMSRPYYSGVKFYKEQSEYRAFIPFHYMFRNDNVKIYNPACINDAYNYMFYDDGFTDNLINVYRENDVQYELDLLNFRLRLINFTGIYVSNAKSAKDYVAFKVGDYLQINCEFHLKVLEVNTNGTILELDISQMEYFKNKKLGYEKSRDFYGDVGYLYVDGIVIKTIPKFVMDKYKDLDPLNICITRDQFGDWRTETFVEYLNTQIISNLNSDGTGKCNSLYYAIGYRYQCYMDMYFKSPFKKALHSKVILATIDTQHFIFETVNNSNLNVSNEYYSNLSSNKMFHEVMITNDGEQPFDACNFRIKAPVGQFFCLLSMLVKNT